MKYTRPLLMTALAVFAASGLASCNIVAPVAYIIEGPPKTPAVYEIDSSRPTVIYIDDRSSRIPKRGLRYEIGESAEGDMLRKGVVDKGKLLTARSASRITAGESPDKPMSIVDIGRAAGAEIIIYVEMTSFTISADAATFQPIATANVKVFDTIANQKITTKSGMPNHQFRAEVPRPPAPLPQSRTEREQAYEGLATYTGIALSRLFYEYERDPVDAR